MAFAIPFLLSAADVRADSKEDRDAFFSSDKIVRLDLTVDDAGIEVLRKTAHPWFERKIGQGAGPNNLPEKPYVKATLV